MKKNLTVVSLFLRSVLFKTIWIITAMVLWEIVIFYTVISAPVLSLEDAVEESFLKYIFFGALVLIGFNILLNFKSIASSYTSRLMMVNAKNMFFDEVIAAGFIFLILFLTQQVLAYFLGSFYISTQQSQFITNQTLFLAFLRSDFLRFLIPLSDLLGWLKLLVIIAALAFACAFLPSERVSVNVVQLSAFALTAVLSVKKYNDDWDYIFMIILIIITLVLFSNQCRKDDWYEA